MKKQKIALFHPWIKSKGGAEKVVLEILQKSRHKIVLYTWVYDEANTFEEFANFDIRVIAPEFMKKVSRAHLLRGLFLPLSLFEKIELSNYDKLLISTSGVAEFFTFRNKIPGKTIAYVHTPLREASDKIIEWNLKNRYENKRIKKIMYTASVKVYRFFEKIAWRNFDTVIFNSELSKSRAIERNLLGDKKSKIINPPIDFSRFENINKKSGESFVYISRINMPKRQDILIKAWKKSSIGKEGYKLIITGNVDNREYYANLCKLALGDESIQIKTDASNEEINEILSSALAGIFLGYQEDFGIVPLEILASRTPLLAVNEGGYVDLVKNNPLFSPIKEMNDNKKMITEVSKKLQNFVKNKKNYKIDKIKTNDFIKEMDEVLE